MTILFLDLIKKLTSRFGPEPAFIKKLTSRFAPEPAEQKPAAPPVRAVKKPASERLSKTVLPHATRSFSPPDPFRSAAGATSPRTGASPLELGSRGITVSSARRQSSHLPPALARALEPKLERAISLRLADFIDRVPAGYIKPVEILDASAQVSLKASEIEKGMADKNPTISLPSLYQQVPEIFLRGVRPDDETRVALPYEKVLEQFESVHVRSDQLRDPAVPQLDTPILKATMQDSERFGTKVEPLEIAAAEPDAFVQETPKFTSSGHPIISLYSPELKPKSEPPPPSRTGTESPFDLSPNGTGGSASERVPASSGPPVPTPLPFAPEQAKLGLESPVEEPKAPAKDETPITLSLKAVLQSLPAFQLNGDIAAVSEEARVSLPLALLEPQLATGRISIAPDVFQAALPEPYREFFQIDEAKTTVALPLEEVLKNLPATILKLRDDQEGFALDTDFETPFSAKAKEDAQRLVRATTQTPVEPKTDTAPAAEKRIDPKEIVAQASALPGVKACAITFSDGLSLAGELPEDIAAEGLCAMAPPLLERIAQHVRETKIGPLVAVTLYTSGSAVSFFAQGNICLAALHAEDSLTPQTRTQIAELVGKLSRTYA
jgi:hypothetical protein